MKILTPLLSLSDNKYLDCLWHSLKPLGVDVSAFNIYQPFKQFKASLPPGNVFHLQWIDILCQYDSSKPIMSLRSILSNLRKLIYLKAQGFRIVWTVHNSLGHDCQYPIVERIFRLLVAHICSDIIVMSEFSRLEVKRIYKRSKRVHMIPHGNYIDVYPNFISTADSRIKLGLEPHLKVFLFFGAIKPYKGISTLINAFGQVNDSDVRLLIAGSPKAANLVAEIELAAQNDPRILARLEFIPDEDIQLYMNASDWVVLPFQRILNSGSVLLALSFGRPVIVPRLGSIPEIIVNGENGYSYGQESDLHYNLNQAKNTTLEQWQKMCDNSYQSAQEYDWSNIASQIYQVYSSRHN